MKNFVKIYVKIIYMSNIFKYRTIIIEKKTNTNLLIIKDFISTSSSKCIISKLFQYNKIFLHICLFK